MQPKPQSEPADDYLDLGDDSNILGGEESQGLKFESDNLSLGLSQGKKENRLKKDDSFNLDSPALSKSTKKSADDSFGLGSSKRKDSLGLDDSLGGGDDSFLGGSEKAEKKEPDSFGYHEASEAVGNDFLDFQDDSFERERKKKAQKQSELDAKRKA